MMQDAWRISNQLALVTGHMATLKQYPAALMYELKDISNDLRSVHEALGPLRELDNAIKLWLLRIPQNFDMEESIEDLERELPALWFRIQHTLNVLDRFYLVGRSVNEVAWVLRGRFFFIIRTVCPPASPRFPQTQSFGAPAVRACSCPTRRAR
eukprot:2446667-Rhodomonas_salina.2